MQEVGSVVKHNLVAPVEGSSNRVLGFDILRFVAVATVIWFHTHAPGSEYAHWHVPSLVIISVILACEYRKDFVAITFAKKRAFRILLPWLFWCLVFGVVDVVRYLATDESQIQYLGPLSFLCGTSLHLWFLPFIFLVTVVSAYLRSVVTLESAWQRVLLFTSGLIAILCLPIVLNTLGTWQGLPIPFPQWIYAFPAIVLGLAWGLALKPNQPSTMSLFSLLLLTIVSLVIISAFLWGARHINTFSLVAFGLVLLASLWRGTKSPSWLVFVASITMGVYLVHPLLIVSVEAIIAPKFHDGPLHATLAIVFSVIIASILMRTPFRRVI